MCAENFYRPLSQTDCVRCDTIRGVSCGSDTTTRTLNLTHGYWRHSDATLQTWRCLSSGSWSPCRGGVDAGNNGSNYCVAGYRGPLCEVCDGPEHTKYFDQLEARCHSCGDATTTYALFFCALLVVILVPIGASMVLNKFERDQRYHKMLRLRRGLQASWKSANMRFKIKALVGFYQCVAAVPSVFDVNLPDGLEPYIRWVQLLELPSDLQNLIVPADCLGGYRTRLWFGTTWPLGLLLFFALGSIGMERFREFHLAKTATVPRGLEAAFFAGLQRVLPLTLGLTFCVVPSTSTRIFGAFMCRSFELSDIETRRYLRAHLALSCDSDEYEATRGTAILMFAVWPIGQLRQLALLSCPPSLPNPWESLRISGCVVTAGVPLLYTFLLMASWGALSTHIPTRLSRATTFLSADCTSSWELNPGLLEQRCVDRGSLSLVIDKIRSFLWEPLEMCRKLTLSLSAGILTTVPAHVQPIDRCSNLRVGSRVGPAYR